MERLHRLYPLCDWLTHKVLQLCWVPMADTSLSNCIFDLISYCLRANKYTELLVVWKKCKLHLLNLEAFYTNLCTCIQLSTSQEICSVPTMHLAKHHHNSALINFKYWWGTSKTCFIFRDIFREDSWILNICSTREWRKGNVNLSNTCPWLQDWSLNWEVGEFHSLVIAVTASPLCGDISTETVPAQMKHQLCKWKQFCMSGRSSSWNEDGQETEMKNEGEAKKRRASQAWNDLI